MLFEDKTLPLVQKALAEAKLQANKDRKEDMAKRLCYYMDDQEVYLEELLSKQFIGGSWQRMNLQKEIHNVVKQIIDARSLVYKEPAKRELDIDDEGEDEKELYSEIMEMCQIDSVMPMVNRLTNLMKTVLVKPTWRKNKLDLDIYTPNILDVIQDDEDPTRATAVIIEQTFVDTRGNDKIYYIVWTAEEHKMFDQDEKEYPIPGNDDKVNPYGILPFAKFVDQRSLGRFWNEGGADLINAQDTINIKLTELNYLMKYQCFSYPVAIGLAKDQNIPIDPSLVFCIPPNKPGETTNKDFKFVTPDAKITELLDVLRDAIIRIARAYKISPDNFKLTAQVSSGFALKMQNIQLLEQRTQDIAFYRQGEQELYEVIKAVWNYHKDEHNMGELKADRIKVDFAEPEFPENPVEELKWWEQAIRMGVKSTIDLLMYLNPDIRGRMEAVQKLKELNDEKRQTQFRVKTIEENLKETLEKPV